MNKYQHNSVSPGRWKSYMVVTAEQKNTPPNDFIGLSLSKLMAKRTKILFLTVLDHIADVSTEVGKKKKTSTQKHSKSLPLNGKKKVSERPCSYKLRITSEKSHFYRQSHLQVHKKIWVLIPCGKSFMFLEDAYLGASRRNSYSYKP